MMQLDRRVTFERATNTRNAYNETVQAWVSLGQFWARRRDISAGERYRADEVAADITTRFVVRYGTTTASLTPRDRLTFHGVVHNIVAIREVQDQRKRFLEIDAVARNDALDEGGG